MTSATVTNCHSELCNSEERLPSGVPKEEFGRMIFGKKSSLRDRTEVQLTPMAAEAARGGEARRQDPCILWRVLNSGFMQARVRLSCSKSLIRTGHRTFRRHTSPPWAAAVGVDWILVRSPRVDFFQKSSDQILPSALLPAEGSVSSGVRNALFQICDRGHKYL